MDARRAGEARAFLGTGGDRAGGGALPRDASARRLYGLVLRSGRQLDADRPLDRIPDSRLLTFMPVPLADAFPEAVRTFKQWLGAAPRDGRCVVLCHFDADGLAAGALFGRGLPLLGFTDVVVVPSGRDESAFTDSARARIRELAPASLIVTDLGVHKAGTLESDGIPVLYVDHHRPSGAPSGSHVVSGYDWDPIPCSAWLAHDLLEAGRAGRERDARAGLDRRRRRALRPRRQGALASTWRTRSAVTRQSGSRRRPSWSNAARRASTFRARRRTRSADAPRRPDVHSPSSPDAAPLWAARDEVKREMVEARKAAPVFSERDVEVPDEHPCRTACGSRS